MARPHAALSCSESQGDATCQTRLHRASPHTLRDPPTSPDLPLNESLSIDLSRCICLRCARSTLNSETAGLHSLHHTQAAPCHYTYDILPRFDARQKKAPDCTVYRTDFCECQSETPQDAGGKAQRARQRGGDSSCKRTGGFIVSALPVFTLQLREASALRSRLTSSSSDCTRFCCSEASADSSFMKRALTMKPVVKRVRPQDSQFTRMGCVELCQQQRPPSTCLTPQRYAAGRTRMVLYLSKILPHLLGVQRL